jgi:hypothetical protein
MGGSSIRVRIAGLSIRFESGLGSDVSVLRCFFKYHLAQSAQEPDCTVVLKRQMAYRMPKDAERQWQSKHQALAEPEETNGRHRVHVPSATDAYGIASCYYSRTRDTYYYGLMRDRTWVCYTPSAHRIDYVLKPSVDAISAMPLLMHVLATVHGRFLFHGAAVCVNGKAHLFVGKSGSGKSTLSTDLAKQHIAYMGDDLVLVYMQDGVPMIGALLFQAKLHIGSDTEKSEVDIPAMMQTDYCLSAPLAAVYLVRQSGGVESTIEPRPAAELMEQLLEASNSMRMQYDQQQWLATLFELSERIPYFIFHFGDRALLDAAILTQQE